MGPLTTTTTMICQDCRPSPVTTTTMARISDHRRRIAPSGKTTKSKKGRHPPRVEPPPKVLGRQEYDPRVKQGLRIEWRWSRGSQTFADGAGTIGFTYPPQVCGIGCRRQMCDPIRWRQYTHVWTLSGGYWARGIVWNRFQPDPMAN